MSPAETIRARLEQLAAIEHTYKLYAQQRLDEQDWHGLWDVAVNLSEVSCERDGLLLAYTAIMAEPTPAVKEQEPAPLPELHGSLPACSCVPFEGRHNGHSYECAMVVKALEGRRARWRNIEVRQTPFGVGVYDRRFEPNVFDKILAREELAREERRASCEMPMEGGCLCALPVGHQGGHSCRVRHNTATCESASRDGYPCQKPPGHEGEHRHDVKGAVFPTAYTWSP